MNETITDNDVITKIVSKATPVYAIHFSANAGCRKRPGNFHIVNEYIGGVSLAFRPADCLLTSTSDGNLNAIVCPAVKRDITCTVKIQGWTDDDFGIEAAAPTGSRSGNGIAAQHAIHIDLVSRCALFVDQGKAGISAARHPDGVASADRADCATRPSIIPINP